MSPARWMITCELRFLLTDSRLACEDAGCLITINLKKTGEGVGLCQIAKHLNLTHGVNHTPLRCSRTQDNCFITDLAWSVSNRASQILLLQNQIVLLLLPPLLLLSYCTFETLPFSMCLYNIPIYWVHSFLNQFSSCIKGQWKHRPVQFCLQ